MSEQKRKLEQDFRRLSELCVTLDAEKTSLKAKYEKVIDALKKYKSISVCLEDGDTFVADETLKELGEE